MAAGGDPQRAGQEVLATQRIAAGLLRGFAPICQDNQFRTILAAEEEEGETQS